ncbi:MAG: DNA-binding response regulator [Clostridiales bacterium]|nr:DNA-binding response regulator [Clostridiales bacterium]
MRYQNGKELLPEALFLEVQKYAEGVCIYIPRQQALRQPRCADLLRNQEICRRYAEGESVRSLAEEFFLSPQAVYRILSKNRK